MTAGVYELSLPVTEDMVGTKVLVRTTTTTATATATATATSTSTAFIIAP
jgi:hypothetical protein